jgi:predicted phage gp36 major capsid-like protein
MRSYFMPAIAIAMIMPATARSDDIPNLDVRPICRGIASQSADPLSTGLKATFEECMRSEQDVREQLKKAWPTFSAADKQHCLALAKTGGESSNTELLTCLEMARDVRGLRSAEAASSSGAAATRAPSSPSTLTVQPAPADSASRPSSEPTNMDVDSTLKELQRVKADAQNARASEALAQRKLANAEADLKRAQEEAGRATKEAEQAKADATAAREAKSEAERKLANAEVARTAAEERQRASESAAKSKPGLSTWLPSWLRSWFGW